MATNSASLNRMFGSNEWSSYKLVLEERLDGLRSSLETSGSQQIVHIQGQIFILRWILGLEEALVTNFDSYFGKEDDDGEAGDRSE